jgi:hypothetical protein
VIATFIIPMTLAEIKQQRLLSSGVFHTNRFLHPSQISLWNFPIRQI